MGLLAWASVTVNANTSQLMSLDDNISFLILFSFQVCCSTKSVYLGGQRIRMENVINWSSTQSVDYLYIKMVMMATSLRHKRSWKGSGKVAKWGSWLCSDLSAVPLNIGFQPAFPHAPPPPPPPAPPPLPPPPPPPLNTGMHSPGSRVDQAGCNPEAAQIVRTWSKHGPPTSLLPPHGFTVVDAYERGVTILFWLPPTCAPNCFGWGLLSSNGLLGGRPFSRSQGEGRRKAVVPRKSKGHM